jgi:hypothetical protein
MDPKGNGARSYVKPPCNDIHLGFQNIKFCCITFQLSSDSCGLTNDKVQNEIYDDTNNGSIEMTLSLFLKNKLTKD